MPNDQANQSALRNQNPSTAVKNELTKIEQIKSMIVGDGGEEMDEKLILDTIEGETDIHEILLEIAEEVAEKETMVKAINSRIEMLTIRKQRLDNSARTLKTIILSAMDKAGLKTIKGPAATISIKKTARGLVIVDESKLPSKFFISQDPKLDKKAVKDALKEGDQMEGAHLDNGGISLQIKFS